MTKQDVEMVKASMKVLEQWIALDAMLDRAIREMLRRRDS